MKIDPNPPGLLSRRTFPIDQGRWVMQEEWDIGVPGCPMIRSRWHSQLGMEGNKFIRQVEMTAEEHSAYQQSPNNRCPCYPGCTPDSCTKCWEGDNER